MKTFVTLFLCLLFYCSHGQNWDFFPKDSLRCYTTDKYGHLMGIDFRDHDSISGNSVVHLDSFGNFIELDTQIQGVDNHWGGSIYFRNKNSHFGNRMVHSSEDVKIIFTNPFDDNIDFDTLLLLNKNEVGTSWMFYENDEIVINARVVKLGFGIVNDKTDSIKTIHLWAFNKEFPDDSLLYNIRIGKRFGIFEIPRLSGLIKHNHRSYFPIVDFWMPYRELSAYQSKEPFATNLTEGDIHYECWMSDIAEYLRVRKKIVDGRYVIDYEGYKVKYLGFENTDTTFSNNVQDYKWYMANDILWSTVTDGVFDTITFEYIEPAINPIPGRIVMVGGRPLDPQVTLRCDSTYMLNFAGYERYSLFSWRLGNGAEFWRHNKDIFYTSYREGETRNYGRYNVSYAENIGYIGSNGYFNSEIWGDFYSSVMYHPNEKCNVQKPIRFASVKDIHKKKQLEVYPNPTSNTVNIPYANGRLLEFEIQNSSGVSVSSGNTSGTIQVDDLSSGLYVLQIIEGCEVYRARINIIH